MENFDRLPEQRSSVPINAPTTANVLIQGVHCLKDPPTAKFDVVFLSGPKTRWVTRDEREWWPATWVPEAFPLARVLMVDSPPSLNFWKAAINLINSLVADQVSIGSRPFFLVAHSVGGLLLKELMLRADKPPFRNTGVGRNCMGVVFYDVPHLGGKEDLCSLSGLDKSQLHDICSHECFRRNLDYRPIEYPSLYFIGSYNCEVPHGGWYTLVIGVVVASISYLWHWGGWYTLVIGVVVASISYLWHWGVTKREALFANKHQLPPESAALGSKARNLVFVKCGDHFEVCKPKEKTDLNFALLEDFIRKQMDADEYSMQYRGKEYVGLEEKVKAVSGLISKGFVAIAVVSLNGMGGVGKTTLAREVVDHIRKDYEKIAWVEVTAEPNVKELQDDLAKQLSIELVKTDPIQRQNEMREKLKHSKVLVVLDNVWDPESVPLSAVDLGGQSCLILTTRDEAVATKMKAEVYDLHILDKDLSEQLFCRRAAIDYGAQSVEMQALLSRVVERCAGLPLAIEAVAATAQTYGKAQESDHWRIMLEEWEKRSLLAEEENPRKEEKGKTVNGALLLSFDELRKTEKDVFLLLRLLPSSHRGGLLFFLSKVLDVHEHRVELALTRLHQRHLVECRQMNRLQSMTVAQACEGSKLNSKGVFVHDLLRDVAEYVLLGSSFERRRNQSLWLAKDYKQPNKSVLHLCINATFGPPDRSDMEIVCTGALRSVSAERVLFNMDAILGAINLVILVLVHGKLHAIPPQLSALTNLTVLDLSSNQLSSPIPPQLSALTNLTELYLWNNQLSGHIPPQLSALTNLTGLYLSSNQLSGHIPPQLSALTNLTGLYLSSNQLSGPIPPQLSALTNLTLISEA